MKRVVFAAAAAAIAALAWCELGAQTWQGELASRIDRTDQVGNYPPQGWTGVEVPIAWMDGRPWMCTESFIWPYPPAAPERGWHQLQLQDPIESPWGGEPFQPPIYANVMDRDETFRRDDTCLFLASSEPPPPPVSIPPAAPVALSGMAGVTSATLAWQDMSENEERFAVDRDISIDSLDLSPGPISPAPFPGDRWLPVGEVGVNVTSIVLNDLTPQRRYRYRVRACNTDGCTPGRSPDAVQVVTLAPPPDTTPTPPPPPPIALDSIIRFFPVAVGGVTFTVYVDGEAYSSGYQNSLTAWREAHRVAQNDCYLRGLCDWRNPNTVQFCAGNAPDIIDAGQCWRVDHDFDQVPAPP